MARTTAVAGQWTAIPDTGGKMLLEARFRGVYVSTSAIPPSEKVDGYALTDGQSMVITEGVTVSVWPITEKNTDVLSHLI